MGKALYLTLQPLIQNDGISRKIKSQQESLEKNNLEVDLCSIKWIENCYWLTSGDTKIIKYGQSQQSWKIGCRYYWKALVKYILKNDYKFIYIRYTHFASPWTIKLMHQLHRSGIKIFLEIPTYPYDAEYHNRKGFIDNIAIRMERLYRMKIGQYVNRIVTFSADDKIWGCPTIKISNGVTIDKIPIWRGSGIDNKTFRMIAVAAFSEWHGYDRLLYGLAEYLHNKKQVLDIKVELVGPHNDTCIKLIELTKSLGLESMVSFPGALSGEELDKIFERSNIAIGSLGRHRSGIDSIRTLKNREYAARAIPFVYSESDPDFDDKNYIYKVPADESPIIISNLIDFSSNSVSNLKDARSFIEKNLTWDRQMQIIKEQFDLIQP